MYEDDIAEPGSEWPGGDLNAKCPPPKDFKVLEHTTKADGTIDPKRTAAIEKFSGSLPEVFRPPQLPQGIGAKKWIKIIGLVGAVLGTAADALPAIDVAVDLNNPESLLRKAHEKMAGGMWEAGIYDLEDWRDQVSGGNHAVFAAIDKWINGLKAEHARIEAEAEE